MAGPIQATQSLGAQTSIGSNLDLQIIDETYGKNADLYQDVLGVPTTATQDEIQVAYFDRRSELFTMLAKIDAAARGPKSGTTASLATIDKRRYKAERKMESVVFVVRILTDPALRIAYDKIRGERLGLSRYSGSRSGSSTRSSNHGSKKNQYSPEVNDFRASNPRVVTPSMTDASSGSESKNWMQSTFSSQLFSNIGGGKGGDEDVRGDEQRNPRKSKRRQKQQQPPSSPVQERDSEPVRETWVERAAESEKKSIWGRKKKKKKVLRKDSNEIPPVEITDSSATEESRAENEEIVTRKASRSTRKIVETNNARPTQITKTPSPQNNTGSEGATPREGLKGGAERNRSNRRGDFAEDETVTVYDDDTTRRDDDTRTYLGDDGETFATGSVFSSDTVQDKATCSISKTIRNITDELSGACEDTLVSVDQVFHAFTLTEKDIKAVTKKITKAKRQLES